MTCAHCGRCPECGAHSVCEGCGTCYDCSDCDCDHGDKYSHEMCNKEGCGECVDCSDCPGHDDEEEDSDSNSDSESKDLDDQSQYHPPGGCVCGAWRGVQCHTELPGGYVCSRPTGHTGPHVACCWGKDPTQHNLTRVDLSPSGSDEPPDLLADLVPTPRDPQLCEEDMGLDGLRDYQGS